MSSNNLDEPTGSARRNRRLSPGSSLNKDWNQVRDLFHHSALKLTNHMILGFCETFERRTSLPCQTCYGYAVLSDRYHYAEARRFGFLSQKRQ